MEASTWGAAIQRDRSVLIVVNSRSRDEIGAALEAVDGASGLSSAAAIVPAGLRPWFIRQGLPASRVVASRLSGVDVELLYFLESPFAIQWALRQQCDFATATKPYVPLNEEVDEEFEQRVAAILGAGRYVAHTLPGRDVFLFTAAELWRRGGRNMALKTHAARQQGVLADLHRRWVNAAQPSTPAYVPEIAAASAGLVPGRSRDMMHDSPTAPNAVSTVRRLTDATVDLLRQLAAPRIQVAPPGAAPAAGWIPSRVDAIRKAPFVADGVKWKSTRLAARATAAGPYSLLFVSAEEHLQRGDAVVAAGHMFRGGVTIGLQKNDAWVSSVDVEQPGPFIVTVIAQEPGKYRLAIANCLRGTESRTAFVVRRLGWTRGKT